MEVDIAHVEMANSAKSATRGEFGNMRDGTRGVPNAARPSSLFIQ